MRFRASFGGRVNVLSCLWAFGAAVGVHMDRLHPSVMNTRVRVVGHGYPRRSGVAPVLGGVKKSIIRCEYMLKLGVFCIALVIVMHKEA